MMLGHSRLGEDLMSKINKQLKERILRNVSTKIHNTFESQAAGQLGVMVPGLKTKVKGKKQAKTMARSPPNHPSAILPG